MLLSILIPTLDCRRDLLARMRAELEHQIVTHAVGDEVEVLTLPDDGQQSIGAKRNRLLDQAQGEFVAFVDDDDEIGQQYLSLICDAIRLHPGIDCIGIKGLVTFKGRYPHVFVHSLQYTGYSSHKGVYYRPPYHLNPIRRAIACRYRFLESSYSEDIDWAMRLCRDRALQTEYLIDEVIYFYHSRRPWQYQFLIDVTEPVRHRLGLQLVNRIRFKRWLAAHVAAPN